MRRWARRLALLLGSLAVALLLAGVWGEWRARRLEAGWSILLDWDEPGRKYVNRPGTPKITEAGFREPLRPHEKPEGTTRVVVVGDSVTFGGGVPHDRLATWVAQQTLKRQGAEVEVINLAVHGYDVEQIAATLRHRGWDYQPDLVVYALYTNDSRRSQVMRIAGSQTPVYVGTEPVEGALGGLGDWLQRRSALFRQARGAYTLWTGEHRTTGLNEDFFTPHLQAMKADAQAHGVPLVVWGLVPHVLGLPLEQCWNEGLGAGFCRSQIELHERFRHLVGAEGLVYVSALPALQEAGQPGFFLNGNLNDPDHPNADGHAVFGANLAWLIGEWMEGRLSLERELPRPTLPERKGKRPPKKKKRDRP